MTGRILILILCFFASNIFAQKTQTPKTDQKSVPPSESSDDLLKHLKAAEAHQISGDLTNAAVENRAVLSIALQRLANIAIEEGKYADAVKIITQLLKYENNAANRTLLAITY